MSDNLNLTERPNLEQLRNLARERQRATPGTSLAAAQRDLAREYGFASWSRLKHHVEAQAGRAQQLALYVGEALGRPTDPPEELLDEPAVIALNGDPSRLAHLDPRANYAPRDWPALLYLGMSRKWDRPDERPQLRMAVRVLLDAGADPDANWVERAGAEPLYALYGLVGQANDLEAVTMMLDAGATAGVPDAFYHATEHRDHEILRLLLARGFDPHGTNAIARMLDFEDPEGLDILLGAWSKPDEDLHRALHHALVRGRGAWAFERLIAAGADPGRAVRGTSLYAAVSMMGRDDVRDLLRQRGYEQPLTPSQAFLAGDTDVPPAEFDEESRFVFVAMASKHRVGQMERLLHAGMDVNARGEGGKTALHDAAFVGDAALVRVLLDAGADLSARETWHNGTPLNWCVFSAGTYGPSTGDHVACARLMLERGAASHCSPPFLDGLTRDLPEMRAVLYEFGVLPVAPGA